jgi:hypothetical protein
MVCDFLRTCYRTKMRFFSDNDTAVNVRWFFCKPGAKVFPGYNRFASGNNSTPAVGDARFDPLAWKGPGELAGSPRTFVQSVAPQWAAGQRFCGTLQQFAEGVAFDPTRNVHYYADGAPACCVEGPPPLPRLASIASAFQFNLTSAASRYLIYALACNDNGAGDQVVSMNGTPMDVLSVNATAGHTSSIYIFGARVVTSGVQTFSLTGSLTSWILTDVTDYDGLPIYGTPTSSEAQSSSGSVNSGDVVGGGKRPALVYGAAAGYVGLPDYFHPQHENLDDFRTTNTAGGPVFPNLYTGRVEPAVASTWRWHVFGWTAPSAQLSASIISINPG